MRVRIYLHEMFVRRTILICAVLCALASGASAQTGLVRPVEEVILQSEVAGVVSEIAVVEGQLVKRGTLLVSLKNDRQKAALALSQAGLMKARAAVEETQVILDSSKREQERIQIAADALPRRELETISDQVLRLKANLNAQVAEVERAEQEVRLREWDLSETELRAPFDGTVTKISINRGDSIRPMDTPLLELVDLEELYAQFLLPSNQVQRVRVSQHVSIRVEGEWMGASGQVQGVVSYISPTIDAASRTFEVKVSIPTAGGVIRPGMLAEANLGSSLKGAP